MDVLALSDLMLTGSLPSEIEQWSVISAFDVSTFAMMMRTQN